MRELIEKGTFELVHSTLLELADHVVHLAGRLRIQGRAVKVYSQLLCNLGWSVFHSMLGHLQIVRENSSSGSGTAAATRSPSS